MMERIEKYMLIIINLIISFYGLIAIHKMTFDGYNLPVFVVYMFIIYVVVNSLMYAWKMLDRM